MKALTKKLYGIGFILLLTFVLTRPVNADTLTIHLPYRENILIRYLPGGNFYSIYLDSVIGNGTIQSVTCTKKKSFAVGTGGGKHSFFYLQTLRKNTSDKITIKAKTRSGKTRTYTCKVTVKQFKTPVKSIKVKKKNVKKEQFYGKAVHYYFYDSKGKGIKASKLKITPQPHVVYKGAYMSVPNGSITKDIRIKKQDKIEAYTRLRLEFYNTRTRETEWAILDIE